MNLRAIDTHTNKHALLQSIGVDGGGLKILEQKMQIHWIYISGLHVAAANILKQDALSIGADLAVPKGVILCEKPSVDAILIANSRQIESLSRKELAQPFGLKKLALELKKFLKPKREKIKVMGVINANDDSFFKASRFSGNAAIKKIHTMIEEGADIIDIGAVSSRPGSAGVSAEAELARCRDIFELIYDEKLYEKIDFSIDSYTPEVIQSALESGFKIVNDITGLADDRNCELAAHYQAEVVLMHMQGTPQTMQQNPFYEDVVSEVEQFFHERLEKAERYGIKKVILDVGIGFGKRLEDNLKLLRDIEHFTYFGCEVLIGASRKSMIDKILPTPVEERLPATLAIHLDAVQKGAGIVRCHDVKAHVQALSIYQALDETQSL